MTERHKLSDDLLRGAGAIATFLFGKDTPANRRRVYHLARTSRAPLAKLGGSLCARRSRLIKFLDDQEQNALEGR